MTNIDILNIAKAVNDIDTDDETIGQCESCGEYGPVVDMDVAVVHIVGTGCNR